MLAGISVDYLVRLEQGRDQSPSGAVLSTLSDALRLSQDERRHLVSLVAATTQTQMCPPVRRPSALGSTTVALLERLNPTPAAVVDPSGDVVAHNPAYEQLMRPAGLFELEPPNLVRYTFLAPASRSFYRDWGAIARDQVANLRAATASCAVGGTLEGLVGELSVRSVDFARLWARHDVGRQQRGVDRIAHPLASAVELACEVLILDDPSERRLVAYLPANEASAGALDRLASPDEAARTRAGRLRVVDGAPRRRAHAGASIVEARPHVCSTRCVYQV